MAQATERAVLVISHGSPSHPVNQEIAMRDLACRFRALLPGREVRAVTLAARTVLPKVVAGLEDPILCPWFTSDGWFVRTHLPNRLAEAGLSRWVSTPPLGLMPGLGELMTARLQVRLGQLGWTPEQTTVILAAHGSPSSAKPREATEAAAKALARRGGFKAIHPCYVDEPPAIRDIARRSGQAIVLPFFAARAGHVTGDLPEELAAAAFDGPVLDPVGVWPETTALALAAITHLQRASAA
ncbi:sirohydrochlorin chelatase [uncultured Roseobacter sp.]|uniref:sirohydrochlorin chelatase n=1 Tax=uncultured Roseobacter sp. TaxID=114847 RepID=UPI0026167B7F|nr:CbiX/SirB N-terminal domain-containing protein [uncultured Roseobacter sp.]